MKKLEKNINHIFFKNKYNYILIIIETIFTKNNFILKIYTNGKFRKRGIKKSKFFFKGK